MSVSPDLDQIIRINWIIKKIIRVSTGEYSVKIVTI